MVAQGPNAMDRYVEFLMHQWQTATLMDYANCVIAIIVLGWFVSRHSR